MDIMALIPTLAIGAVAGWLAGILMKGGSFGLIGNIIVGVIGSFVGTWLLGVLGVSLGIGGIAEQIATAVIGASALLFSIRLIRR